jgi:hypothetical protein
MRLFDGPGTRHDGVDRKRSAARLRAAAAALAGWVAGNTHERSRYTAMNTQRRLGQLVLALSPAPAAGGRPCINEKETSLVASFLEAPAFAVVGASKNRTKFGNKILRCYMQHDKPTTPVSPKEAEVEKVAAVKALSE